MSPRERVCRAFRLAYEQAGLTQEALAEATGIRQATISKYARGETQPSLDVLEKVDRTLGKRLGHVLRLAGYVEEDTSVLTAIAQDPALDDASRRAMVASYHAFAQLSTVEPERRAGKLRERLDRATGPVADPRDRPA